MPKAGRSRRKSLTGAPPAGVAHPPEGVRAGALARERGASSGSGRAGSRLPLLLVAALPIFAAALLLRSRWEGGRARTGANLAATGPQSAHSHSHPAATERLAELVRQVAANPGDPEARLRLAEAHREAGEPDAAARTAEQVVKDAPARADAHLVLARARAAQGREAGALEALGRAASLAGEDARLLSEIGRLYQDLDSFDAARRLYERAVAGAPRSAAPRLYLGQFFLMLDDTPGAIAQFRKAAVLEPGFGAAHLALADAALRMGRTEEAAAASERALQLRPGDPDVLLVLAQARLQQSSRPEGVREAMALLEQAADAAPGDALARYNLGRAALRVGDAQRAAAVLEQAVRLDPSHLAARMNLARAYQRLGRREEARRELEIVRPLIEFGVTLTQLRSRLRYRPRDPEIHYRIGELYLAHEQREQAAARFRKALLYRPDFAPAREALARLEREPGPDPAP